MGIARDRQPAKRNIVILQLAILVFAISVILLIVGAVMIAESQKKIILPPENNCEPSTEAKRVGLFTFLKGVNEAFFKYKPYKVGFKPGVTEKEVRETYRAFDPTPIKLKQLTDYSMDLLKEINETKRIDEDELKPRERRMLAQVKLFLKYNFGSVYEGNFYNGDFMLGPNFFCASPICEMGRDFKAVLPFLKPSSVDEVSYLENKLKEFNTSIDQYISNLRLGVKTGFVRSMHACKAGLETLRTAYPKISLEGEKGIVNETFAKDFFSNNFTSSISSSVDNEWQSKSEKSVKESLRQFMVEYVGKSFVTLFRYLEKEHMVRCVPDKDYSGLAKLPVPFVYMNGTKTNQETTNGELPGTDIRANGKQLYLDTLRFFTISNATPDAIYDLGWTMLNKIYPQVIDIAMNVTRQTDNNTAKVQFLRDLDRDTWFFGVVNIPEEQSNEEAQRKCINMETAQQHCEKRLEAIEKWFADARGVMALIEPKTTKLLHFAGKRATTPNCPVVMRIDFNPASGVQSYMPTNPLCTTPAGYRVPFWKKKPGPSWGEYGVNSHEARPGHHTQVMGFYQNFEDNCGTPLTKELNKQQHYQAFIEGWALYSESLIMEDTDLYETTPDAQYYKYGNLKWQLFRALRLIIDTGLHYKGYSREWALQLLADRAWETSDMAQKEITRYQSGFGQATAYMVGKQRIIALRNYAKEQLQEKFNIKDFHFFLLYQGGVPLDYLEDSIRRYVKCVQNKSGKGCDEVLDPLKHVKAGVNYPELSSSYVEESIYYA